MMIQGIPSGDLECWCLLVTKDDFWRVTGREPEEHDMKRSATGQHKYMLYPENLMGHNGELVYLKIEVESAHQSAEK